MKTFKDLDVWRRSVSFATDIYSVTKTFPKEETYGLVSQLRRAGVSIASNIAEDSKKGKKEFSHFIKISQGSGAEIETQLIIAKNLNYIKENDFDRLITELESIMRMLTNLYKSVAEVN
ncbi:MAG: four helix bundle protein [Candidatus Paceibacterota bacterium]